MVDDRKPGQRLLDALKPTPENEEKVRDATQLKNDFDSPGSTLKGPDIQTPGIKGPGSSGNSKAGLTENQKEWQQLKAAGLLSEKDLAAIQAEIEKGKHREPVTEPKPVLIAKQEQQRPGRRLLAPWQDDRKGGG